MSQSQQTIRKRKLQAEQQPRAYQYKIVPSLHLSGIWLEENGFKIGEQVEILVRQNELIIKTKG